MAEDVEDGSAVAPDAPPRRPRTGLMTGTALLVLGVVALWSARAPIADTLVADELRDRGVPATYRIDAIGPRTQRLLNVVIGDPDRPDLTAKTVELDLRWTWGGPQIAAIRADGVRLRGRWADGRIRLGEVDKLLPPPSAEPFALPAIDLTLTDARAAIMTPWAQFGVRADGQGVLARDFRGTLAVVTDGIQLAGCTAGRTTAYGDVHIRSGAPRLVGPVRMVGARCAAGDFALARADARIDAAMTPDLSKWQGRINAASGSVGAGGVRARTLTVAADFTGTAAQTAIRYKAEGRRLQFGGVTARKVVADGTASLGSSPAPVRARVELVGGSLSAQQQAAFAGLAASGQGGPFAPIAAQLTTALRRAASDFSGEAEIALTGDARTRRVEIIAPGLRSVSGATVRAGQSSRAAILLGGKQPLALIDGNWAMGGGGLPDARLRISRNASGAIAGSLVMTPYSAGTSRLALTPVTIRGDASGRMRLVTRASLSGPVAGGRIDGLAMAIDAVIAPNGAVQLASGCQQIGLTSAALAGLRLGANRVRLCSAPGQPLLAFGNGGLRGDLLFLSPALTGTVSANPLSVQAQRASYALASGRWAILAPALTLGSGEAATLFRAASIVGAAQGAMMTGKIAGGEGSIGTVPLAMTAIEGDWRWSGSRLTLDGGLVVSDRAVEPRFAPLISTAAKLTYADNRLVATASFAERETGTAIGRAELAHDFTRGSGGADLVVAAMRFNDAFQPDQLTPLALGVIANTQGTLAGRGRIDWTADGVTSSGTFTTAGSDFAAAFGSVRGASTTIVFDDLLGLRSAPGQRISLDEINPGFSVIGGRIDYQWLDATNIRIEGGRWPFAGGELILKPTTLDFDVNAVRRMEFELRGVDAAVFLSELGFENINASGVFDGVLPVEFSGLGGRIVDGRLVARAGGGQVAYVGELSNYNLGTMANFTFNMLKSLRYENMEIVLNGDLDGEMLTDVKIIGIRQGEGATRNMITRQLEKVPIIFNVKINAPFRQLISSAKSLYDPSVLIDDNLYTLIGGDVAASGATPVQPPESEPVP